MTTLCAMRGPLFIVSLWAVCMALAHLAGAHSTISSTGTATSGSKKSSANLASTDSLAALMDANFLESVNSASAAYAYEVHDSSDEISDNSLVSFRTSVAKTRKQAENQAKTLDWWARFAASKNTKARPSEDSKAVAKSRATATPASVYREQPLSQNPILTIRNQLEAIREKHRQLVTKSQSQLMQLDQKLIDSYKMCLKRKMPLYAGMLYRTRDFVVRMANEVKHERQVLAAITKQAQRLLRQKTENRTLVRDYNQAAGKLVDLASGEQTKSGSEVGSKDEPLANIGGKSKRSVDYAAGAAPTSFATTLTRAALSSSAPTAGGGTPAADITSQRAGKRDAFRWISDESSGQAAEQAGSSGEQQTPASGSSQKVSASADKIGHSDTIANAARGQERIERKKSAPNGNKSLHTRRQAPVQAVESNDIAASDAPASSQQVERLEPEIIGLFEDAKSASYTSTSASASSSTSTTTRKPKAQQTYTVHINEVNLKRELLKTQALIDRINTSSVELMGVVDDIVYLFKLSSGDYNPKKGLAMSGKTSKYEKIHSGSMLFDMTNNGVDKKRAKKIAKHPFKVLLERYNRLTSTPAANLVAGGSGTTTGDGIRIQSAHGASQSDMNNAANNSVDVDDNNLPELRPLFSSRSLNVDMDPNDLDLGFDAPAVIEIQ